jgi:putative DNA primase/helicase
MFGERFQLVPTVGKLVNLAPEADSGDTPRIGVLKQFTGGDTMSEDRKGTSPISLVASAKLIIAANSHPSFVDRSDGLWRRLVYVPFDISVAPANQDAHLVDKLKQELPGIFNWALLGYKRLLEQQLFTVPVLSRKAAEAYELESNSVRMFLLEEGFEEGGECDCIEVSQLYHHYAAWSKANGHSVWNGKNFGKELRRTFPKVTRVQKRVGGKRVTAYVGLARAADAPEPEYAARGYRPEAVAPLVRAAA